MSVLDGEVLTDLGVDVGDDAQRLGRALGIGERGGYLGRKRAALSKQEACVDDHQKHRDADRGEAAERAEHDPLQVDPVERDRAYLRPDALRLDVETLGQRGNHRVDIRLVARQRLADVPHRCCHDDGQPENGDREGDQDQPAHQDRRRLPQEREPGKRLRGRQHDVDRNDRRHDRQDDLPTHHQKPAHRDHEDNSED
jgi:hypothetical protein